MKPKKKITTFIFDIGNVILYFDHQVIVRKLSNLSGIPASEIYDDIFHHRFINQFEKGLISEKTFYKKCLAKLKIKISFAEFAGIFSNIFTPNAPLFPVIRKLKTQGCRLCILSNTDKTHFEYLSKRYPVMGLFNSYYLSYKLHCMKPETRIFKMLLKKENVLPEECLYTDDISKYTDKARRLGINSVHFKSAGQFTRELKKICTCI